MTLSAGHQKNILLRTSKLGKSRLVELPVKVMHQPQNLVLSGTKHLDIIMMLLLVFTMMGTQVCHDS